MLLATHILIEGESNPNFPSYLSPKRICSELTSIPVLNFKSNEEKELVLIDIKYLSNVKFIINEMIKRNGFNKLFNVNFNQASLIFSFLKNTGNTTKIEEQKWIDIYKNNNIIEVKILEGKECKLIHQVKNLNKLADFHELDEEN